MKKKMLFAGLICMSGILNLNSQDPDNTVKFNVGADFYTSYIFRGTKYGTGPSIQPSVRLTAGNFTAGVWGSFDAGGYSETDPFVLYAFSSGFTLGFTDYYYPEQPLFDVTGENGNHAFEVNAGFGKWGLNLSANYILNEAGGAGSSGGDMYFQAGYTFTGFSIFAGAGNGWHTRDGEFNLCNIGIGTGKELTVTEKFSVPVTGQIIVNPGREQLFVVAGFLF